MVQVLPYVQTPLEQLTPYINQAVGQVGKSLAQRSALRNLQEYHKARQSQGSYNSAQTQIEDLDPIEFAQEVKMAQKAGIDPVVYSNTILSNQKAHQKESSEIRKEERKVLAEQKKATEEKREHQGNIQKTFNVASSLLAKNTPGVGISPGAATGISRKAVEGRNTFNTLRGKFESILLPMVNKGTLAKERFNFILSQIPDAADSQRAIAGKLRGLAETLSEEGFPIDTKVLDSIPWASKELKELGQEETSERPPLESFFK